AVAAVQQRVEVLRQVAVVGRRRLRRHLVGPVVPVAHVVVQPLLLRGHVATGGRQRRGAPVVAPAAAGQPGRQQQHEAGRAPQAGAPGGRRRRQGQGRQAHGGRRDLSSRGGRRTYNRCLPPSAPARRPA